MITQKQAMHLVSALNDTGILFMHRFMRPGYLSTDEIWCQLSMIGKILILIFSKLDTRNEVLDAANC